jgi:hypothetical protein
MDSEIPSVPYHALRRSLLMRWRVAVPHNATFVFDVRYFRRMIQVGRRNTITNRKKAIPTVSNQARR